MKNIAVIIALLLAALYLYSGFVIRLKDDSSIRLINFGISPAVVVSCDKKTVILPGESAHIKCLNITYYINGRVFRVGI